MTLQPARHECHACCPLQAEKPGIQPVVGNTHGTHVEQVVSSFQKILRGSQLTWYIKITFHIYYQLPNPLCIFKILVFVNTLFVLHRFLKNWLLGSNILLLEFTQMNYEPAVKQCRFLGRLIFKFFDQTVYFIQFILM